jgi:hypothetical protein
MISRKWILAILGLLLIPTQVKAFTTEARIRFDLQIAFSTPVEIPRQGPGKCTAALYGELALAEADGVLIEAGSDSSSQEFQMKGYCPEKIMIQLITEPLPDSAVEPILFFEESMVQGNFTLQGVIFFATKGDRLTIHGWKEELLPDAPQQPIISSAHGWSIFRTESWQEYWFGPHHLQPEDCHTALDLFLFDRVSRQEIPCQGKIGAFRSTTLPLWFGWDQLRHLAEPPS